MKRYLKIDRAIYWVDEDTRTYGFNKRNPDWIDVKPEESIFNLKQLDGYTRVYSKGRTRVFHFDASPLRRTRLLRMELAAATEEKQQYSAKQTENTVRPEFNTQDMTDEDYRRLWDKIGKIQIRCVEKNGQCVHNVGDTYYYDKMPYRRPDKVCYALLHVMELYTWRVALGFPSWNAGDRDTYKVHCPDRTGTLWEMKRIE